MDTLVITLIACYLTTVVMDFFVVFPLKAKIRELEKKIAFHDYMTALRQKIKRDTSGSP